MKNQAVRLYDTEKRIANFIKSGQFTEDEKEGIEVPFVVLESIIAATDNFSAENKLGQGGFGPVYKVINAYSTNPHFSIFSNNLRFYTILAQHFVSLRI